MSLSATLGRYRLGERIGEGGMGEVFSAELEGAEGFTRKVAIKKLRKSLAADPFVAEQLIDEARIAKRLTHGGIVQILDVGLDDDRPFLVTELVDGVSLADLASVRKQPVSVALFIVEAVADALAHAHGLTASDGEPTPIVHRDVKPANILLSRDGVVKLADFGIGKALSLPSETAPGMIKGTLGYLSLEQARGDEVDERTDQFSLGVVLYELLTGSNPLAEAPSLVAYLQSLESGLPALDDDVDPDLAAITLRAAATDPNERFASIDEFRDELVAWRVGNKIKTRPDELRAAVRELAGGGGNIRAALGAELGLGGAATEAIDESPPPKPPGGSLTMAIGGALIVLASAVLIWRFVFAGEPEKLMVPAPRPIDAGPLGLPIPIDASQPTAIDAAAVLDAAPRVDAKRATKPTATKPGELKVNVLPWAYVKIDGKKYGQAPVTVSLPPGSYRVDLENSNRRKTIRVRVVSGEQTLVTSW